MKKSIVLLVAILFVGLQAVFAQSKTIKGTVTGEDGEAIPGASIMVKGTTVGTVTDFDGEYSLKVPESSEILVFSFVGMITQEQKISGSEMDVVLETESVDIEDVMVVAYGTAKKESFTGSAEVVSASSLKKRNVSNVTKALEGQVSGVQVTSGGGQPGSSSKMVIRGFGSINSSVTPLYVVDGIPYDGALNSISPSDIESVSVLKDASAGALYGARGANGVVIITTKKGKSGKTQVSLKVSTGISNRGLESYDVLGSKDFIETNFQAYKNYEIYENGVAPQMAGQAALNSMISSGTGLFGVDEQYNPYDMAASQLIDPSTGKVNPEANLLYESDWLGEITRNNAPRKEYELSINGGTEKNKVYSSLSYLDEEGILKGTSFERFTGRVRVENEAKKWVKYGANLAYGHSKTDILGFDGSSTSNVWYSAQFMSSLYPVYQRDANDKRKFVTDALGDKVFDTGANRPAGAQPNFNSVASLYDDKNKYTTDNVSGRIHLDLLGDGIANVVKGLSFKTNFGIDYISRNSTVYYNPFHGNAAAPVNGRLSKSNSRYQSYTFNQLLGYEREIGKHSFNILVGHESYAYKRNYLGTSKTGFPYGDIYELAPGATIASSTSYEDNYTIESCFSSLTYDYDDKYYFSASYRNDGSSRFHKDYRWGDFWSVGASWRISEESFMDNVSFVDNLKVKGSYGIQGNDALLNSDGSQMFYGWQALYSLGWPNASSNGAMITSVENKPLKWEENASFNVGLEGKLFEKLDFSFEYFNRTTNDMLMMLPMATSLGFDGYWANVGEMNNKGVDITLGATLVETNNVVWNAKLMGSKLQNEIVKLDGQKTEIIGGVRINREGEELNSLYLTRSAGVDPNTGEQLYWVYDVDENGKKSESYVSNDRDKAATSKEIIGSRIPDFSGSFTTDITAFGFDLSVLTAFSYGGYIYDAKYRSLMEPMYRGQNYHSHIKRAWQNPGDVTDVPRVQAEYTTVATDRFVVDASYFAIKNISLGYTFPKSLLKKAKIESLRIYGSVDNVKMFSHLDGMDPQYNFSGSTAYTYTPTRTSVLGLEIKF